MRELAKEEVAEVSGAGFTALEGIGATLGVLSLAVAAGFAAPVVLAAGFISIGIQGGIAAMQPNASPQKDKSGGS